MSSVFLSTEEMRLRRLRQRVRAFVDLCGDNGQDGAAPGKWAILMLSYRGVGEWQPGHITAFVDCVKHWAERRGFKLPYCWVAEWQARGALHYHVLVKLPRGVTMPMADKQGWWKHGSTNVGWVRKSGKRYMAKYASKETQRQGSKERGLRLCGAGGLGREGRAWYRFLLCPRWVRHECNPSDYPRRVDGGYKLRDGTYIPSPYTAVAVFGGVVITERSQDEWAQSAIDHSPHVTHAAREDAYQRCRLWGDARYNVAVEIGEQCEPENPWANQ